MNPVPTDAQWLVLYQIEDGDVVYAGEDKWRGRTEHGTRNVTGAVNRLHQLGLVGFKITPEKITVHPTDDGIDVLKRRSIYEVLDRLNRRQEAQT